MSDFSVGSLENEALQRKERLKALRLKRENCHAHNEEENAGDNIEQLPKPVFRNYKPTDDSLKDGSLPRAQPEDVTVHVADQLSAARQPTITEEIDLSNLAPRKPDWDLKRDIQKRLDKLERRTQRAIAELIRDRLSSTAGGGQLAEVVGNLSALTTQLSKEAHILGPELNVPE